MRVNRPYSRVSLPGYLQSYSEGPMAGKRTVSIVFLFFILAPLLFSFGKSEKRIKQELAKEGITAVHTTYTKPIHEYVFLDQERVILVKLPGSQFSLLNITTNEEQPIEFPVPWQDYHLQVDNLTYDRQANALYMLVVLPKMNLPKKD
jgi:hypothetical protein